MASLHFEAYKLLLKKRSAKYNVIHDSLILKLCLQEVDVIKRCQERMRNTIEKANVQLG